MKNMLVYRIPASGAVPFVLADVKAHCRVSDDSEDDAIARLAWAAALEIEQYAGIALLHQTVRVTIFTPAPEFDLRLPTGPAAADTVPTVTFDGAPFTDFTFVGGNRPCIHWPQDYFDRIPNRMTVEYLAGFGADATHIPPDLAQAVADQAAAHYDGRSPMDARAQAMSPHMARIGARYRGVQV